MDSLYAIRTDFRTGFVLNKVPPYKALSDPKLIFPLKIGELKPSYVRILKLNANLTILRHATETLDDFQTFPL